MTSVCTVIRMLSMRRGLRRCLRRRVLMRPVRAMLPVLRRFGRQLRQQLRRLASESIRN